MPRKPGWLELYMVNGELSNRNLQKSCTVIPLWRPIHPESGRLPGALRPVLMLFAKKVVPLSRFYSRSVPSQTGSRLIGFRRVVELMT
jgi:hypothetical protein